MYDVITPKIVTWNPKISASCSEESFFNTNGCDGVEVPSWAVISEWLLRIDCNDEWTNLLTSHLWWPLTYPTQLPRRTPGLKTSGLRSGIAMGDLKLNIGVDSQHGRDTTTISASWVWSTALQGVTEQSGCRSHLLRLIISESVILTSEAIARRHLLASAFASATERHSKSKIELQWHLVAIKKK